MIQLPPLATHGAVQEADCTQDQDGGRRSLVAGRRNLLPKSRSADRTMSGGAASHFLNLQDIPETQLEGWNLEGCRMSEARNFRRWAAQVARQAGEEPDANEAQRLLSIAEYWVRLAEMEDCSTTGPVGTSRTRLC